jgi:hypothetical protein
LYLYCHTELFCRLIQLLEQSRLESISPQKAILP